MRATGRTAAAGFTIVELVVTLALAAALFAFAVPSYSRYIAEQRLLDDARRLADAITLARSEAIKRNRHVILCAATAVAPCGELEHWHEGWVMFEDVDGNSGHDAIDEMVGNEGSASSGVTMTGNRPVERYLRFDYSGRARLASGALQMGTIEVCKSGLRGYRVVLANTGRTRLDRTPGDCP